MEKFSFFTKQNKKNIKKVGNTLKVWVYLNLLTANFDGLLRNKQTQKAAPSMSYLIFLHFW